MPRSPGIIATAALLNLAGACGGREPEGPAPTAQVGSKTDTWVWSLATMTFGAEKA